MKGKLLLLMCLISAYSFGQTNISLAHSAYSTMKQNGTLDVTKNYLFTDAIAPSGPPIKYTGAERSPSSICSCMIALDSTFSYVPFVTFGSDPTTTVYGPGNMNDDASTAPITLPFSFNFYGVNHTQLFINNNGNVSFNFPYSQFTSNPFPDASYNMIAPFWGDVDTRDFVPTGSGLVYYKITPTALIVKWENVGYYDMHFDKLNTFQLILTDGTDPLLPAGMNVGYCYGDMQWTTGDVTGSGGFGSPATVGVNQGNGADYFQVGTFFQPTTNFDGPYNSPDGVNWLDNQGMYFDIATTGNIPPVIINNNICDTIDVYTGDTMRIQNMDSVQFVIGVTTPEISQTVTGTLSCTEPAAFSYIQTMNTATYKQYLCTFVAQNLPIGLYYINITATDNGIPVKSTNGTIIIRSNWDPGTTTGITDKEKTGDMNIFPNPTNGNITIKHGFNLTTKPTLHLTDVIGKAISTIVFLTNEQTLDLNNLPQGIYFATISTDNGNSKTMKIIKK